MSALICQAYAWGGFFLKQKRGGKKPANSLNTSKGHFMGKDKLSEKTDSALLYLLH